MSAALSVLNSFSGTINGLPLAGWQGMPTNAVTGATTITLAGKAKVVPSQLANNTALVIYDDTVDTEVSDVFYLWYQADQSTYIQLINTAGPSNVAIGPLAANVPICIGAFATLKMLAAASSTALTSSAPSTVDVNKIVIGNYSGNTTNFTFGVFL